MYSTGLCGEPQKFCGLKRHWREKEHFESHRNSSQNTTIQLRDDDDDDDIDDDDFHPCSLALYCNQSPSLLSHEA